MKKYVCKLGEFESPRFCYEQKQCDIDIVKSIVKSNSQEFKKNYEFIHLIKIDFIQPHLDS